MAVLRSALYQLDMVLIVTILAWIIIIITSIVILYKPKNRLARAKNIQEILDKPKLAGNKFYRIFNPFMVNENDRFQATITIKAYWIYFTISLILTSFFILVIFQIWYALPLGILISMAAPSFMLFLKKRKQRTHVLNLLSIYISTVANMCMTFGNPITAYEEILKKKYLPEPLHSDIERILIMISSNIPLSEALKDFENKYGNISYLGLFHQYILISVKNGGDQSENLFSVSVEYDLMLDKRQKSFLKKYERKRSISTQAKMALSIPVIFLVLLFDYYKIFLGSTAGKLVLLLAALATLLSVIQSEREVSKDFFR